MARSMLKSKNMLKEFRAEVVACTVYLSNWYHTKSIRDKTPQEARTGFNPKNGKVTLSRDVEFDEDNTWEWKTKEQDYSFSPLFDEEDDEKVAEQPITPPSTPPAQVQEEDVSNSNAAHNTKWRDFMDEEIKAIKKNDTCELAILPKGKSTIGVKWVYKLKKNFKGKVERYKARLVAKGYKKKARIDYDEVFALIARLETIRFTISLAAQNQ
ncbi:PREDICTED: uncharacterized protein LOC109238750 [Nicotiana attenuata]|uniref:uncharacterized protein LOC109238750 n=1 Tax=Nicotiana attenuata TaxID=49451 RepID=UPI000904EF25|nr:PREDICTED: uncharacterized protein LOC109238750 [Nicotiana attenuata]